MKKRKNLWSTYSTLKEKKLKTTAHNSLSVNCYKRENQP